MSYLFQIFCRNFWDSCILLQNNLRFFVCLSVCSLPYFHTEIISSLISPVKKEDFPDFYNGHIALEPSSLFIVPSMILQVLKSINKNASTVNNDVPMRLIVQFSNEVSLPLTHIINCMFEQQVYPQLWKKETITPVPKVNDTVTALKQMRPISGLLSAAKIANKILSRYILSDMGIRYDKHQCGNEKGMSINHLLINLLHKILVSVDKNSENEKYAVILTFLDFSQAFERQSHKRGI